MYNENCHVTKGQKKCHVLFEWPIIGFALATLINLHQWKFLTLGVIHKSHYHGLSEGGGIKDFVTTLPKPKY